MQRRLLYLVLSFALTVPLFAVTILLDPPAPSTGEAIRVRISGYWPDSCVPVSANISAPSNGEVMIGLRRPPGLGCLTVLTPFSYEVVLPPLPAGTWRIVVHDDQSPLLVLRKLGEVTVVVATIDRAVEIEPRVIPAGATTPWISIRANQIAYCPPLTNPCPIPTIRFNGETVRDFQLVSEDEVLVRAPLAAATTDIDVAITAVGFTTTLENAIRIGGSAYDPALYERVLIPVIYNGPGAHGSQWRTDVALHNSARAEVTLRGATSLGAGETRSLTAPDNAPAGHFIDISRGSGEVFQANALIRDTSRQNEDLGTEMPIVREHDWHRQKLVLMNLPSSAGYRVTIRAYAFDGTPEGTLALPYVVYAMNGATPLARGEIRLTASNDGPAYGTLDAAQLSGAPLRYEFGPLPRFADPRFWAFASITNNTTQHVTVITPQ